MKGCLTVSAILVIVEGTRRYQDSVKDRSSGLWNHKLTKNLEESWEKHHLVLLVQLDETGKGIHGPDPGLGG